MPDVPGVSDDELIRTSWGDTVAAEVNNSVKKTGAQTMAGPLSVTGQINANGQINISDTPPAGPTYATRKDYVDDVRTDCVAVAGDVMTGNLIAPVVLVNTAQSVAANALTRKDYVDGGHTMTGTLIAPSVRVNAAQDTAANALTRKDYVDDAVAGTLLMARTQSDSIPQLEAALQDAHAKIAELTARLDALEAG